MPVSMAVDAERDGYNIIFSADTLMVKPGDRSTQSCPISPCRALRACAGISSGRHWTLAQLEGRTLLYDKQSGVYFDPAKLHDLNHHGKHFQVRGPLNVARSPQGHLVVVQAGSCNVGRELASETAKVVFTAETDRQRAQAFYTDVKSRMARHERHPDHLKIMPCLYAVVGRTEAEAHEENEQLQSLIEPDVGLSILSEMPGAGLYRRPANGYVARFLGSMNLLDVVVRARLPDGRYQARRAGV